MSRKKLILILEILLIIFNTSSIFAYWANQISGDTDIANGSVAVGTWVDVPEGGTLVDEDILVDLLSGEIETQPDDVFVLPGDIDLSDNPDNTFEPVVDFQGTFEGNGNTISGFEIIEEGTDGTTSDYDYTSIFLHNSGTINNVIVENVEITLTDTTSVNNSTEVSVSGVLVGENEGVISNAEVRGSTIIVNTDISTSYRGTSTATALAGGLVGINRPTGVITNSYSQADLIFNVSGITSSSRDRTTSYVYAGGLVGQNQGTISYSYASGDVTTNISTSGSGTETVYTLTGGLVGYSAGNINHSFATGNIIVNGYANYTYYGHLYGYNNGGTYNTLRYASTQTFTGVSGNPTDQYTTSSTTVANLQSASYLSSTLGFDFTNIWEAVLNSYPIIKQ